jgi:hypothetical protein
MLPPDEQAHGFSTNAEALAIHPALLDRYLSAARKSRAWPSAIRRFPRGSSATRR